MHTRSVGLYSSTLLVKPAGPDGDGGAVGWHADFAYTRNCSVDRMLTAWLSLWDCDERSGGGMASRSNRWSDLDVVLILKLQPA